MSATTDENYASTLIFSLVCTNFEESGAEEPEQTITRIFEKTSSNLSQYGCWRCVFTETKKQTVELQLSLCWVPNRDTCPAPTLFTSRQIQDTTPTRAQEPISRIKSIKVRSDSTLSELLVGRLDGRRILEVKLQPVRVLRKGRYKFRIAFHTQDISRSWFLERTVVTSFLDIDSDFEPTKYQSDVPPDVCFQFPTSLNDLGEYATIHAHSFALEESGYFAQRLAKVTKDHADLEHPFYGIVCTVTEFSPTVFRAMLRYLYTGKVRLKKLPEEDRTGLAPGSGPSGVQAPDPSYYGRKSIEPKWCKATSRHPEVMCFEDLYRIGERYEISALKALALRAMQCTLNMSLALSILAKISPQNDGMEPKQEDEEQGRFLHDMVMGLAVSIVKEYIQFFGTEMTTTSAQDRGSVEELSIEERKDIIWYIGEIVLRNISRFWE
ncbi:hypothetical protein BG011_003045 [Mortierella polycephala]|uniref:BTB domain-containing protein n=1 Tax=Mortierella polycephala TaxID=41804 RepID=A0A9P6U452_9FUNG|nr:hypothetical protein BG011_003045 [Mortierella polycephala]